MSEDAAIVTARHFAYVAERTQREDAFCRRLKAAARKAGIPAIWIGPAQASFLQILLKLVRAREVVDVGTLAGYSAIMMARSGARVRTIEINPRFADFAEAWIAKSDVARRVKVLRGDADAVLATIRSADAVFLDADKSGYPKYLRHAKRILRPGGLLLVDNAFAFGQLFDEPAADPETPAVRRFNEIMARERAFHSVIVPIGDGLWVGVRR